MERTERIQKIYEKAQERWQNQPLSTFDVDKHTLARTKYKGLEKWEKLARSMAEAMVMQPLYLEPEDRLVGRIYHLNSAPVENPDPDFDYITRPRERLVKEYPDYVQVVKTTALGHIIWGWNEMLRLGTDGMKENYRHALERAADEKARQFYQGVLIMLDAVERWSDRHAQALEEQGRQELADLCRKVPRYPAESFYEAVQSFYMQHILVMRENPFGGNGPGRLDYYLWPYLERDLKRGACTLEEARELIDELFIRIDERIHGHDTWVEAIVVGGSHPDGSSAVNPLSHIMVQSIMDLNLTHPSVYIRLPKEVPEDFMELCVDYVRQGGNRAQVLSDENIIKALTQAGVPSRDAVEYCCGGCMEIGLQGMTSDFLYNGYQNLPKLLELCITGGTCLRTGEKLTPQGPGLGAFASFEDFYRYFIGEAEKLLHTFFRAQDVYSEEAEVSRPSYLISSMIQDCLLRGRNMHGGGARYHDYGSTPIGLPDTADSLYAVKRAVFEEKLCTVEELLAALRANFEGYTLLRKKLLAIPKYGQGDSGADGLMARLCADISRIYTSWRNRFGGMGKLVVLTFRWAPEAGAVLGARPDGSLAGRVVSQGVTPQSASMRDGITTAMNSCTSLPFQVFNGGASTMWDLDPAWATDTVVRGLLTTFFENGGQIYQGNTTDLESLRKAQENPEEYYNLIVRVGGYSARFVNLSRELQDNVIARVRHAG